MTSALEVTSIGTICDLDVKLDIRHAWDEDLDVNLVGPDGTEVLLFSDVGGMGIIFLVQYLMTTRHWRLPKDHHHLQDAIVLKAALATSMAKA